VFNDKYKYFNIGTYWDYDVKTEDNSWNRLEFVSVDKDDKVIGYLKAGIDRSSYTVSSLAIINFYDINMTFSRDLHQFLVDIFMKYNFTKIEFSVVVGNPAEMMYDKYIAKYGGRIVGTFHKSVSLQDGKLYDVKYYEIFRDDYVRRMGL
jgi:hypothetical protein